MTDIRGKDGKNGDLRAEFDDLFEENLRREIPHHQAYQEAENEFRRRYNHNKYSSFESYRISRSTRIRSRGKKKR
jgi:hypothetical protein